MRSRTLWSSLLYSIVLMIFPVASGVIVAVNELDVLQGYWVQGAFMLLSITVPAGALLVRRMKPGQIGLVKPEKGSIKTVLYFIPILAAKIGFLLFGTQNHLQTVIGLVFFTAAIGLSEEIYFRGVIFRQLLTCFPIKRAVALSSAFFAAVHASQALSGAEPVTVLLTVANALLFGIVAAEIVVLTGSLVPVILWHALYDFINWIALAQGTAEVLLVCVQSVVMTAYAVYLWTKLPDKRDGP